VSTLFNEDRRASLAAASDGGLSVTKLRLNLACWNYDRTRALADRSVQPEGIDLNYLELPVEETFFRMLRYREFDVAELSLSSYTMSLFTEQRPFIAIPVFPSRFFRHSCIYVNAAADIRTPKDLIGKRIGTPEYQMTAPVWIRGILSEHYDVPVDAATYRTGGEEEPGRLEKMQLDLPSHIKVQPIGATQTLSGMLADGEIDALYTARMPSTFSLQGGSPVRRLFPNYRDVEQEYFRKTRIFPIMHTVAIRRDVYERNRWIAQSLYKAFLEAQHRTYEDLYVTAALKTMLPWLTSHVEETRALMGEDFWSYGIDSNRAALATFLRYHHEQGLSKRLLEPEELFAPETLLSFKI
jgi:4,5-dihydroxyphthalate decarboxylase